MHPDDGSNADTRSSSLDTMQSPLERTWSYTASWEPDLVDTFCYLNDLSGRSVFTGTFAEFRIARQHTFPYSCVANFSDPGVFEQCEKRGLFLEDGCPRGSFGSHLYCAVKYADVAEKFLVRALGHNAAVAVGKIGLDYSESGWPGREKQQKRTFRMQLALAAEPRLPVIYCRDATQTGSIIRQTLGSEFSMHV